MAMQLRDDVGESRASRAVPAWLLSLLVHLLVLIALALAVRRVEKSLMQDADRAVGVVLAHRAANQKTEYLDESDLAASASPQAAAEADEPSLPQQNIEKSLLPKDIALPRKPENLVGASLSDQLIHVPSISSAGRRPILPGQGDAEILAEEAARQRRPDGPVGPGAKLGIFGSAEAEGHKFVFVIDRSKSMGGDGLGALDAAAKELMTALSQLRPNHEFQIIAYHHSTVYVADSRKMLPATPQNLNQVPQFFATLAAFGSTAHETALLAALRLNPDVIFFLTDGGDPYLTASQIDRIVQRAGRHTSIHCIQFGYGPLQDEDDFMVQLAHRNRGSYRYVDMSQRRPGS